MTKRALARDKERQGDRLREKIMLTTSGQRSTHSRMVISAL
jgi:hypothetical protein